MTLPWTVSVAPYPAPRVPDDLTQTRLARLQTLIGTWEKFVEPFAPDDDADFEDWVEQAERLHAGVAVFGEDAVVLVNQRQARLLGVDGEPVTADLMTRRRWGSRHRDEKIPAHEEQQERRASDYATSPAFQMFAGRPVLMAAANLESLCAAITETAKHGADVRVKCTKPKYGAVQRIPNGVACTFTTDDIYEHLDGFEWTVVHFEGDADVFMVYPHVPMEFEYRVFVVDGKPVAGAGCIENFTPLNNTTLFDPQMERIRNDRAVVVDTDRAERYRGFAERAAALFAAEGLLDYAMDLATSGDDTLVIECNGILNSGLYALDTEAVTGAMFRAASPVK